MPWSSQSSVLFSLNSQSSLIKDFLKNNPEGVSQDKLTTEIPFKENEELNDENWNYCEKCYSYVGVPSTHYRVYDSQSSNEKYNINVNNQDNNSSIGWDKACCGGVCLIIILLWFTGLL